MKTSFAQMSKFKYPFFIIFHPFDGYQELKYNKKGSLPYAIFFVLLWYVSEIISQTATDFAFNTNNIERIDIRMIALTTIAMFVIAVISNWCFSTFMDGKGTLAEIFTFGAYALIPLIATSLFCTIFSKGLVGDESVFLSTIEIVGIIWSAFLIFAAIQEVHDFTFKQTIAMIFFTVLGIVVILFLGFLVYSLVQQVIMFAVNITYEIIYRVTMS